MKRMKNIIFRNKDIRRGLMGTPRSHKHIRTIIELENGTRFVFQEATIANIVRAYVTLKTHPVKRGIELVQEEKIECEKRGYASSQLLESEKNSEDIIEEIKVLNQ
jgi:hypothetical protein